MGRLVSASVAQVQAEERSALLEMRHEKLELWTTQPIQRGAISLTPWLQSRQPGDQVYETIPEPFLTVSRDPRPIKIVRNGSHNAKAQGTKKRKGIQLLIFR